MAKEKLAVDLDDVLCPTWDNLWRLEPEQRTHLMPMYSRDSDTLTSKGRSVFINYIGEQLADIQPIDGSQESAELAAKHYDGVYLITGRYEQLRAVTEEFIQKHFSGIFNGIVFTGRETDVRAPKYIACAQLGASMMIDDWIYKSWHPSIGRIVFGKYSYQENLELANDMQRARTHEELGKMIVASADGRWRL